MVDVPKAYRPSGRVTEPGGPCAQEPHASAGGRSFVVIAGLLAAALLVGRRYIDPGSGSFAIQIIIAAVLGGVLTARLWLRHLFYRIVGRGRRSKPDAQPSVEEADR